MIVHNDAPVTLVGGGDLSDRDLAAAVRLAPSVVAADGGARACLARGIEPLAVIGDMDSIGAELRAALPAAALHEIAEQDSTDFDKALRNIAAPLVLGVGFLGDRLDHQLAALNTLVRHPGRACVLIGGGDLVFLCPPALRLPLDPGCRVSFFPMGAVEGTSDGLDWPVSGIGFAPDGRVGTSNRAQGEVFVSVTAPKMLMLLPDRTLETVVTALAARPVAGWD